MRHGRAHSTPYAGDLLIFAPQNPIAHGNITPTTSTKKAPGKDFCVPNHTLPPLPPFRCATQVIPWHSKHTLPNTSSICPIHRCTPHKSYPADTHTLPLNTFLQAPQHTKRGTLSLPNPCGVTAPLTTRRHSKSPPHTTCEVGFRLRSARRA